MRIVINKIKQKIIRTVFYYRAALIDNSVYSLIYDLGFRRWNVSRKSAPPLRGRSSFVSRFIASKSRYAVGINAFRNVGREKRRRKRFLRFSVGKNEGFLYPDGCSSLSVSRSSLYLRASRFVPAFFLLLVYDARISGSDVYDIKAINGTWLPRLRNYRVIRFIPVEIKPAAHRAGS